MPQGEFISPEDVKSFGFPFAASGKWVLGRIEGELKQKLLELRG